MNQRELTAAIQEWLQDTVILRHEGCQGEGDHELQFSQSPEEFAAELWEKLEERNSAMVSLLTKIGELRYAHYYPIGDQLGGLGDWLDKLLLVRRER